MKQIQPTLRGAIETLCWLIFGTCLDILRRELRTNECF